MSQVVEIKNINDIRKVVVPFMKDIQTNKVKLTGNVTWNEDGKNIETEVSAYSSDVNVREQLLDGFKQVKEQKKLWDNLRDALQDDEYNTNLPVVDIDGFTMPIDSMIRQRLGGKRKGFTVVWNLNGKEVVFDPYSNTLREHDA